MFVDTVDTIRVRSLLEFTHMAHKHTLLIGESGIGKTALINDFIDTQGTTVFDFRFFGKGRRHCRPWILSNRLNDDVNSDTFCKNA